MQFINVSKTLNNTYCCVLSACSSRGHVSHRLTPMSFAAFSMAIEHVAFDVPLRPSHPSRRSAVDAFKATIKRRIPRTSNFRTSNLLAIHHCYNLVLTDGSLQREPCIATFLASLEQVRVSIHGICHPFGIRIAFCAIVAFEIRIKCVLHYPVESFLNTIIARQGAAGRMRIPSRAALLWCLIEVMFWGELHPHGVITS